MAINRIISKKELEDSGLSLRDYMNKLQGLTRKPDADVQFSQTSDKPRMPTTGAPRYYTDYTGPRDKFGIPGATGSPSAPGKDTIDSSELGRNLSNAANALAGPIASLGRIGKVGKAIGNAVEAAEAAPEAAAAAEKAEPVVKVARVRITKPAADSDVMDEINAGLKAAQKKLGPGGAPRPVNNPTKSQSDWAAGPQGPLGKAGREMRSKADTLDENGLAMKRGGGVKKYAKGGHVKAVKSHATGGAINLSNCKITTHIPSKKQPKW